MTNTSASTAICLHTKWYTTAQGARVVICTPASWVRRRLSPFFRMELKWTLMYLLVDTWRMAQAEVVILKSILRSSWKEGAVMFKRACQTAVFLEIAQPHYHHHLSRQRLVLSFSAPKHQTSKFANTMKLCQAAWLQSRNFKDIPQDEGTGLLLIMEIHSDAQNDHNTNWSPKGFL